MALVACNKPPPPVVSGEVIINAAPLKDAFASAQGDTQQAVRKTIMDLQGSYYVNVLEDLDKLSETPGLTDQQKKAIADLLDQVKKKAQEAAGAGQ